MIDQMKVYVQNDPDLFRKAIKRLSREYDLKIRVGNSITSDRVSVDERSYDEEKF
jgi:endo-alpha-1,4-polygalactosaminidase (GH114 family)